MGFLGDILNGLLEVDAQAPFGQRLKKDDHVLRKLYQHTYFDFGLNPPMNLKDNEIVPMWTRERVGNLDGFEIRGKILSPGRFLSRGWGSPFHTIEREMRTFNGRVWAFDITRLHESVLSGRAVYKDDAAYVVSEEYLKILRAVGGAPVVLAAVPAIGLEFGEIWGRYGIPDRISVSMQTTYPLDDYHLQQLVNLILHAYNRPDAPPVTADYSKDISAGTVTLIMRETNVQPAPQAYHEPQTYREPQAPPRQQAPAQQPEPQPSPQADPNDGFPYDFYRGLGLINDDNTVTVPSMLGPVNVDMTNERVKLYLLDYKP